MVGAATSEGADADPVVSRAVAAASAGPYLVAAMGFAALLGAAGLSTLRSGVFPRWTGIVALIGAVAFLITLLTVIAGTGEDSVFGYGFLPGILALVIWSIATSIARYRALEDHCPRARREDRSIEPVSMTAGSARHQHSCTRFFPVGLTYRHCRCRLTS